MKNSDVVELSCSDTSGAKKPFRNRFNCLSSKEWLPFQKSWFRYEGKEKLYKDNFGFFTSAAPEAGAIFYHGKESQLLHRIVDGAGYQLLNSDSFSEGPIQFAIIDLLNEINDATTIEKYQQLKQQVLEQVKRITKHLLERRFLAVFIPNIQQNETYFPFAWALAKDISAILSLKDEKIGCVEDEVDVKDEESFFMPSRKAFYCLYFRKDDHTGSSYKIAQRRFFGNNKQQVTASFSGTIPLWFILKPHPRKKNEILHPAKYPEDLVEMFIEQFTKPGDNVFDPMSGTGSTQMAALKLNRNGYGTELSEFFSGIANERCENLIVAKKGVQFKILNKDARSVTKEDYPQMDYIITSPPYWDMLNMKGAENQAKRIEKGLQTNYSNDDKDLGNINDYQEFLENLCGIYFSIAKLLKPGGYFTIVVKNIKKKGRNYPFAWDLANELQK